MKVILNKNILIYLIIIFLSTFNSLAQEVIVSTMPSLTKEEYENQIIIKGDVDAYNNLRKILESDRNIDEFLYYSFVMANKYHYPDAFFYVYHILTSDFDIYKTKIDSITLNIALSYLEKGVELGSNASEIYASELYLKGKYFPQDTTKGFDLYMKGWNYTDSTVIEYNKKILRNMYKLKNK
ncbi:MAG: hypothetical protein ACE5RH_02955 [Nitrosarchaeum sp.]